MSLLTFTKYTELGFTKLKSEEFNSVLADSEILISAITNGFYDFHDIEADLDSSVVFSKYRAKCYLKAIALQCEFAVESGASTPFAQQAAGLTQVTIGRTTLQHGDNPFTELTYGDTGLVKIAVDVLAHTGLLYRGVNSH